MLVICIVLLPLVANAQAMLMSAPVGRLAPSIDSALYAAPDRDVNGQNATLSVVATDANVLFPLFQNKSNDLSLLGRFRLRSFDTDVILPDTGSPFPDKLWEIRFGPGFRHRFSNDWTLGVLLEGGTVSNKPFASFDDLELVATTFLKIPARGKDAWLVAINYMNNREYLPHVPLPAGGYFLNREYIRAFFGIPTWINIAPKSSVGLTFFYAPIISIKAEVEARLSKALKPFIGFAWRNERYYLDGRQSKRDRFFYYGKRTYAGLKIQPDPRVSASFLAGYTFDRRFFEGRHFWNDDFNRIDVDDGPFVQMNLKIMILPKKALAGMRGQAD